MARKRKTAGEKPSPPQNKTETARDDGGRTLNLPVNRSKYPVFAALAVLCLIIYAQVYSFDFINIDDDQYVYENSFVAGGLKLANAVWAFTAFHSSNWHPLTWISHQVDSSLFGLNAGAHHLMNVLFHAVNSCLLFVVVKKLTGAFWRSALVAAIFAVHPAHVESVAWIAERKDVLSTLFWLLSAYFYIGYARDTWRKNSLWISLIFFAFGLMAKPMLVTLPFTFILLDYWALERFEKWNAANLLPLMKEKLPFFALSLISAVITIFAQSSSRAIQSFEQIPLSDRLVNALVSYAKYFAMLFYPMNLGVWYPFKNDHSVAQIVIASIVVLGISAVAVLQIYRRKYLFVGGFWFLGTLVPVIGILQVGGQSLADRYTYIPYIGLSIAVVWLAGELFEKYDLNKNAVAALCGVIIVLFTALSFRQTSYWKDNETLFARTLAITENNYFVEHNLCIALEKKNLLDQAEALCNASIKSNPKLADSYNTLGTIYLKQNDLNAAGENFRKAIEVDANFVLAYANLAISETRSGNIEQAGRYLDLAIEKDDRGFFDDRKKFDAFTTIGLESLKKQDYPTAESYLKKALSIVPNDLDARRNLAIALHSQNRSDEAIDILQNAIREFPNSAEAYNSLGLIYAEQNKKQPAIEMFQKALKINPNFAPARNNLSRITR